MSDTPTQIDVLLMMYEQLERIAETLEELKDAMIVSNADLTSALLSMQSLDPRDMQ